MSYFKKLSLLGVLLICFSFVWVSSALADWVIDVTAPGCSISFNPPYNPPNPGIKAYQTLQVIATLSDTASGGSGIVANTMNVTVSGAYPLTGPIAPTPPPGATWQTYTYNWAPKVSNLYTFGISGYDTAGNYVNANPCTSYWVEPPDPAWLKTFGGDVHINQ